MFSCYTLEKNEKKWTFVFVLTKEKLLTLIIISISSKATKHLLKYSWHIQKQTARLRRNNPLDSTELYLMDKFGGGKSL